MVDRHPPQVWRWIADGGTSSLAISPDGRFVATCGMEAAVRLWEAATGTLVWKYEQKDDWAAGRGRNLAFSPAGSLLAWGGGPRQIGVTILRADNGSEEAGLATIGSKTLSKTHCVAWGCDGALFAGTGGSVIQRWAPGSFELTAEWHSERGPVWSIAPHPEQNLVLVGSGDCSLGGWTDYGHVGAYNLDFIGTSLQASDSDERGRVWHFQDTAPARMVAWDRGSVLAWMNGWNTADNVVRAWDPDLCGTTLRLPGETRAVGYCAATSQLACAWDGALHIRSIGSSDGPDLSGSNFRRWLKVELDQSPRIWALDWTPDGQAMALGSAEAGSVHVVRFVEEGSR